MEREKTFTSKLYDLAENKPILFWFLYVFIFIIMCYKIFNVFFISGPGMGEWGTGFLKFSIALLTIILMKEMYRGDFSFNFKSKGVLKGILLGWFSWIFILFNLLITNLNGQWDFKVLIMIIFCNFFTGFFEEVVMRGFIMIHMLRKFSGQKNCIIKSVLFSSLIFGLIHLGNLIEGNYFATFIQVVYATALGMVFGAVYLLTKNIWGPIILHWLIDLSAYLGNAVTVPASGNVSANGGLTYILLVGISIVGLIVAIYFLRKKNRTKIYELWEIGQAV